MHSHEKLTNQRQSGHRIRMQVTVDDSLTGVLEREAVKSGVSPEVVINELLKSTYLRNDTSAEPTMIKWLIENSPGVEIDLPPRGQSAERPVPFEDLNS